jgi:hypothetical protein
MSRLGTDRTVKSLATASSCPSERVFLLERLLPDAHITMKDYSKVTHQAIGCFTTESVSTETVACRSVNCDVNNVPFHLYQQLA